MFQQAWPWGCGEGARYMTTDKQSQPSTKDLLCMAERWARQADSSLAFWSADQSSAVLLVTACDNALLACALELRAALSAASDFAEAVRDLGLEPVRQHSKGPGA